MSFSWDFIAAVMLVLALSVLGVWVFSTSAFLVADDAKTLGLERRVLFQADFNLKNCFPEGIAYCEGETVFSHIAHPDAVLKKGEGGFCIKRLVLKDNEETFLVACSHG